MKKKLYRAVTAVLVVVLAVSGGYIGWKSLDYRRGAEDYAQAAEVAGLPQRLEPPTGAEIAAPDQEVDDPYAAALAGTDLDALRAVNGDVVGWIAIPETDLSYPLVQGADNQYYLNRTWKKERSSAGAVFLEWQCARDLSDFNTIVYGHRMNNSQMFGSLRAYEDEAYWQAHPSVYVVDDANVYRYDVFAAYQAGTRDMAYRLAVTEEADKAAFLAFALEHSAVQGGVTPGTDARVLTLSTCVSSGSSPYRWVVQASLAAVFPRDALPG